MKAFLYKLLNTLLSVSFLRRLENLVLDLLERKENSFITVHRRPVQTAAIETVSDPSRADEKTAIVLQGPLLLQNHFTLNTIRLYRNHFPGAKIILSTWEGESGEELKEIGGLGVDIQLSTPPDFAGISNINFQIVSTLSGMELAGKSGREFFLKTRTDQRFYAPSTLEFLQNLISSFPLNDSSYDQRGRIVGLNMNTFKYRMYGISDMFLFGYAHDMMNYWQCPLDQRPPVSIPREENIFRHSKLRLCEVYLCSEYLTRIGRKLEWTLEDSFLAYAQHFVVVNSSDLDLFWPKYGRKEYRWLSYDKITDHQQLDFREWLNLYQEPSRAIPAFDFLE